MERERVKASIGSKIGAHTLTDREIIKRQQFYTDPPSDSSEAEIKQCAVFGGRPSSERPNLAVDGINNINAICEGVFLTSFNGMEFHDMTKLGITCVINSCPDLPTYSAAKVESIKLRIGNSPYEDIFNHFDRVADKIRDKVISGGAVLVYCYSGTSRSAALVIAYLIKYKLFTLKKAYNFVKAQRNTVHPTNYIFRQLVDYEKKIHGVNSVEMVWNEVARAHIPDLYVDEYDYKKWLNTV